MSNQAEETEVVEDVAGELEQGDLTQEEIDSSVEAVEAEQAESSESDEVVVSIGDEPPAEDEQDDAKVSSVISDLRKRYRDIQKENRELKAAQSKAVQPEPEVKLGEEPTLEGCDFDGDKFKAELTAWYDRKRQADEAVAKKQAAAEEERKAWNAKLEGYGKQKAALKVPDFEDAEATALESLSQMQQAIILQAADNAAAIVYALGKNPKKAQELASIKDPVKFTVAIARLEPQVKFTAKKAAPLPESRISGAGRVAGSTAGEAKLSQLHEKAQKTGDYSAYYAAKREQAARKAA